MSENPFNTTGAGQEDMLVLSAPDTNGWRDIQTAPHNISVLLAWQERRGEWVIQVDAAATGKRYRNGYSSMSYHGCASHWMPLPLPPQGD